MPRGTNDSTKAATALLDTFGQQYRGLPKYQNELLILDLLALWDEEGGDDELSLHDAAKELKRRLGGARNLEPYADALEAGARYAGNPKTVTERDVALVKKTAQQFGQKVTSKEATQIARLLKGRH